MFSFPFIKVSPSTASSRISFNSIFDLLFKTLKHHITKKDDFSTTHNPLKQGFYYPRGGNIKLMQKLYEECIKKGVKIKNNYGKRAIYPICERAEYFAQIAGTKTLADQVIQKIKALGFTIHIQQETL